MKITNVSSTRIYLADLRLAPESQTVGRRGEDRYLHPGAHVYLPDTGDLLRSAQKGTLRRWVELEVATLYDDVELGDGDSFDVNHDLHYIPLISVVKKVGDFWLDATGSYDVVHDVDFTVFSLTNTSGATLRFLIRCG